MLWVYHGIPVYLLRYVITITIYYITMWIWGPYNYGEVDVIYMYILAMAKDATNCTQC